MTSKNNSEFNSPHPSNEESKLLKDSKMSDADECSLEPAKRPRLSDEEHKALIIKLKERKRLLKVCLV
jgi:hypothetical protein